MAMGRLRGRPRRKILLASMMPGVIIGIPLAMLLVAELRSLGRLEQASRQVLTQTGVRVADELARAIRRDLTIMHDPVLDAVPRVALRRGDLEAIRSFLDTNLSPAALGTFFVGMESAPTDPRGGAPSFTVLFDKPAQSDDAVSTPLAVPTALSAARLTQAPVSPAQWGFRPDPVLGEAVGGRVEQVELTGIPEACGFISVNGVDHLVVLRLMYVDSTRTRVERFTGYAVPLETLTARYLPRLARQIRGSEAAFSTDQPLEVSIFDARGAEAYRTGPSLLSTYVHQAMFPLLLLGDEHLTANPDDHQPVPVWTVRTGYPGTDPAALARSSTNQQRQVLFLVTVVAAVGVVLSGRAVARELGVAELKTEFVSSVSHDLKTPLASIQVLADIIDKGVLPPEKVRAYGTVIGSEARKLGKLIDGMLEFERINSGGRSYLVETIDLRDPVREAIREVATQLKETGFRTELRLPATPVPFAGNVQALSHALGNVIGNAIKYSEDHRFLRVELTTQRGNAVIKVHDRGIGIPASQRSKIFDRFYRVRRNPETDPAGTGLGLPIAEHVVRSHGGAISVESSSEEGSVFRIELPLDGAADSHPPEAER